jgi:hypothetical protein
MNFRRWVATLGCVALVGCATASQKRADAAFERGDYVSAAEEYDRAVREKPDSEKLIALRWKARGLAVSELARRAEGLRLAKKTEAALNMARAAVEARATWFGKLDAHRLPADIAREVDKLASWAAAEVSKGVRAELDAGRPLAARAALLHGRPLFKAAGLQDRADAAAAEITQAGTKRCAELTGRIEAESAHLTHWVARYCNVFGGPELVVPPSPEQVGALKIQSDTLAGANPTQRASLEKRIEELLMGTPWFHPQAPELAAASIGGEQKVSYASQRAQRAVHWVERVPYQARESYTDTEYYTAQESYTEYSQQSYSCGYGTTSRTCSRSVPHTRYRSVQKSRPVTKWRTVTRYRDEPRIFRHDVVEHQGVYASAWDVALAFPAGAPALKVVAQGSDKRSADEHDVTFAPANVHPAKARLASPDDWFDERLKAFASEFPGRARSHWVWSFCRTDTATPESAARCAHGGQEETPEPVWAQLSAFLGDDAHLLTKPGA